MSELRGCLTFAGAICAAGPLATQGLPAKAPATDPAIVVTGKGQTQSGNEAFDEVRRLSRVERIHEEALARFEKPVCARVLGVRADYAAAIAERIRDNAAGQRVPLAKGRCSPNLVVAFIDDGQSVLSRLARDNAALFSRVPPAERDELLTQDVPVRVWSIVETRLASGAPVPGRRGRAELPAVRGRGVTASFTLPTRSDIEGAIVAFDRDAVVGMTVAQLADYATMRGLTHTRPASGDEPMATILALFDADPAPTGLTPFDTGYLRTLYYWAANYSAATKFVGIEDRARKRSRD